ncbi:MAG TPA: rRNA maturation RNase YbeY [Gemmatimonadaceae bacterium]
MSVAVDVTAEGVRVPLARARVAELVRGVLRAERVRDALLSVAFLDDRAMARLNREHLGHRGPTDVISFGFAQGASNGPVVGDVYVCPDVARENARLHGAGVREEVARLVVHGTLHVLGYDHPEGGERTASDMWRRQERLLRRLFTDAGARASAPRARRRATP